MATNADGTYDTSSPLNGVSGLLEAVLGKSTDQDTTSAQTTVGTTNQATDTTSQQQTTANTNTVGSQATNTQNQQAQNTASTQNTANTTAQNTAQTGSTTQATTGTQSTAGTGSQATQGTTTNTGSQATTGTVNNTNTGTNTSVSSQQTVADLSALKDVFNQQQAGITPEMLAAIFQQGSKAAPQLVTANANALGARAGSNTPVAAVLQNLQMDLTAKAADLNRQMLADSAGTAAKIADLSKTVTGTQQDTTTSLQSQVQNLLQQNSSQAIVDQIVSSITSQLQSSQQAQTGTSTQNTAQTGTQNQVQTGTQATTATNNTQQAQNSTQAVNQTSAQNTQQSQNTAATQNQTVNATENKNTATTINTGMAKNLLGMAAAGAGLSAIYKAATDGGFKGAVKDLVSWLSGTGAKVGTDGSVDASDLLPAYGHILTGSSNPGGFDTDLSQFYNADTNYGFDTEYDWSQFGFADGGQVPFLPIEQLIKKQTLIGNQDGDLMGMLDAMGGGGGSSAIGGGSDGGNSGASGGSGASAGDPGGGGSTGTGGGGGFNGDMGGYTVNADGIAVPNSVNPGAVNAALTVAGLLGAPFAGLMKGPANSLIGKTNAANAAAAAQFNQATQDTNVSINGAISNAPTATAGPTGTGGQAADAGASAAASATSAGYTDAAIAAAAQAAASAVVGGATAAEANVSGIQAGAEAMGTHAGNADVGYTDAIGGDFGFSGGDTSSAAAAASSGGDYGGYGGGGYSDDSSTAASTDTTTDTSSSGGGSSDSDSDGCYISTAALGASGKTDAEDEDLATLRSFRDGFMLKDPQHKQLVEEYYRNAPAIVKGINSSANAKEVYSSIHKNYLAPSVAAIKAGKNEDALRIYSDMIASLSQYGGSKGKQLGEEAVDVASMMGSSYANGGKVPAKGSMPGYKDGHQVKGPGTGISDSIAATGPQGQRIAVAKDEYIIPADVVRTLGTAHFDKLIEKYHVPAELQRAMGAC